MWRSYNIKTSLVVSIIFIIISTLLILPSCGDDTTNENLDPPSVITTTAGNGEVTIEWDLVADADSYNLYWSNASGLTKETGNLIENVTSPYTHTNLTNDTTYFYVLTSINMEGESVASSEFNATPTVDVGSITFTWGEFPFEIFTIRAIVKADDISPIIADFNATMMQGTINGIPVGLNRVLTLQGLNSSAVVIFQGESQPVTVMAGMTADTGILLMEPVTPPAGTSIPSPVTNFTATAGNGQVTLTWTNPADIDFAGVRILRRDDGTYPYSPLDGTLIYFGIGAGITDYDVTGGTTYYYAAYANNSVPYYSVATTATATPAAP